MMWFEYALWLMHKVAHNTSQVASHDNCQNAATFREGEEVLGVVEYCGWSHAVVEEVVEGGMLTNFRYKLVWYQRKK